MSRVYTMALGYFRVKGTLDLIQNGQFISDCVDILRRGEKLPEVYISALECIGGQLIGEAMLTQDMVDKMAGGKHS